MADVGQVSGIARLRWCCMAPSSNGPFGLLGDFGVAGYTLEYAAPELLGGAEKTAATDLWAR